MIKRASAALLFVLGLGMQCALASPINIVNNGNFELGSAGSVPGWIMAPDPASIPFGGQSVVPDFSFSPTPHGGKVFNDAAYLTVGYLSQLLATTAGATYTLEFDLQRFDTNQGVIDNFAMASFDGVTLLNQVNVDGDWTHFTYAGLTASGASTQLKFGNRNFWDFNQLDNVSVVKTSADPDVPPDPRDLPEPASTALVLAALGLLGWTRRRQS
jgi:hypothetical protein